MKAFDPNAYQSSQVPSPSEAGDASGADFGHITLNIEIPDIKT